MYVGVLCVVGRHCAAGECGVRCECMWGVVIVWWVRCAVEACGYGMGVSMWGVVCMWRVCTVWSVWGVYVVGIYCVVCGMQMCRCGMGSCVCGL